MCLSFSLLCWNSSRHDQCCPLKLSSQSHSFPATSLMKLLTLLTTPFGNVSPLAFGASGCLHSLSASLITSCFAASFFSAHSVVWCPYLQTLYTLHGWCMYFYSFHSFCLWIESPKSLSKVSLQRVTGLGFSCLVIFLPVSVTEI